jgi:hypothetical protein
MLNGEPSKRGRLLYSEDSGKTPPLRVSKENKPAREGRLLCHGEKFLDGRAGLTWSCGALNESFYLLPVTLEFDGGRRLKYEGSGMNQM